MQKDAKTYLDAMRCESDTVDKVSLCGEAHVCIVAMSSSQTRIAGTLELFYTADRTSDVSCELGIKSINGVDLTMSLFVQSQGAMAGHAYKSAVDDLDNEVQRDLDAPFRATVLEPVGKLCSYYPNVNEAIAKRNKKVFASHSNRTMKLF